MGRWTNFRDKITGHDGTSIWKDAWDAGRGVFGFQEVPDAVRPAQDPRLTEFSRSLTLTPDNPAVAAMATRTGRFLGGLNPAARAAAAQRTRTKGFLGLSQIAPEFWAHLERLAQGANRTAEGIDTTSDWRAGLTGFVGGGGLDGLAMMGAGALNTPSSGNTQDLYLKGAKPGAFQGGFY